MSFQREVSSDNKSILTLRNNNQEKKKEEKKEKEREVRFSIRKFVFKCYKSKPFIGKIEK
ncbi:MAG: hypothetical protein K6253_02725 [Candidatus Liberibacter asiaticus]|nr:hypothetical protein [Candidatus Liberibacter asiaticus]